MFDVGDVIFIDLLWVFMQLCFFVGLKLGVSFGMDGILCIDNLVKIWFDVFEGEWFFMLMLFRNFGLCVFIFDIEDFVFFQLFIGCLDKDMWFD